MLNSNKVNKVKKKGKSKSSQKWLARNFSDPLVEKAKKLGYYSRAVFKLEEIQSKTNLIQTNSVVLDLGAAPGAFSQFASKIAIQGRVIACDLLPIKAIDKVEFIQGDFSDEVVCKKIIEALRGQKIDALLCDIAPNLSGVEAVDSAKSMALSELAYDFALQSLKNEGAGVIKLFQGVGFSELIHQAKQDFQMVKTIKTKASRKESKEIYLYFKNKK